MRQRLPRINARADLPTQAMWSPSLFPQPSSYRAASSLQEAGMHHGPYLGIKLPDRTEERVSPWRIPMLGNFILVIFSYAYQNII